ncbi:MAG: radical SAM protein [Acidobacteria bacterium]|nr:radical SAM protein [Acidobacteriota bacterium]
MGDAEVFPASPLARDRYVVERRGSRPAHDPWRHQGVFVEDERQDDGTVARVAAVLLTGRDCAWRCTMCDLWQSTTSTDTPAGAIPSQIHDARRTLRNDVEDVTIMKLYNAGSFFDPRAVPEADYPRVVEALAGLSRVIVESHPALVGARVDRLLALLKADGMTSATTLEVAMGLETAHPSALERLNKRVTFAEFRAAAAALRERGVALRVFLLIGPPFVRPDEQDVWLVRSIDAAFSCGASAVSLIPTRSGNGAMDALVRTGGFSAPTIDDVERSFALALHHAAGRGRVFLDLWDLDRLSACTSDAAWRRGRLHEMNLRQVVLPPAPCAAGDHRVVE